jgi:hypothetical protein
MTVDRLDDRNLRELVQRGRVFSEMFPGTAASDAWLRAFDESYERTTPPYGSTDDREKERELDETLDETFPASDAPANTIETGIRISEDAGRQPPQR